MKHNHHPQNLRSAELQLKHGRSKSIHLPTRPPSSGARVFDDSPTESTPLPPAGNGPGAGALSDQQRLEWDQASERNKVFMNPIQSVWPTPSE